MRIKIKIVSFFYLIAFAIFIGSLGSLAFGVHKTGQVIDAIVPIMVDIKAPRMPLAEFDGTRLGRPVDATWYDRDHCVGCREDRMMANGEILDDMAMTAAYNHVDPRAGRLVLVCDKIKNKICIEVEVTDAMGYDDRIDLTRGAYLELFTSLGMAPVVVYEAY